jgi:hypothetical protein
VACDDTEYGEEEYYDKDTLRDEAYKAGLDMYQRYGLTKEQYDADLEHREDIEALSSITTEEQLKQYEKDRGN